MVDTCCLVRQWALALDHLHGLEIVLRDLRPEFLWVTEDGQAKLIEFGAALDGLRDVSGAAPATTRSAADASDLLADVDYMAPEQGADEDHADARCDVYALGCVMFRCLTGEVAHPDGNPVRKALRHACLAPPSVRDLDPEIPRAVADVVATMLAPQPLHRYQRARDVAWALEKLIDTEEVQAAVAAEISADFLEWARASVDVNRPEQFHAVIAEPEFIDFLDWVATQKEEEEEDER